MESAISWGLRRSCWRQVRSTRKRSPATSDRRLRPCRRLCKTWGSNRHSTGKCRWTSRSVKKPVVLAFVYYGCPMLCDQVEQGVVGVLRMLSFNPGRDYEVIFVSFDSRETPAMAAEKKKKALAHFRRPETDSGWHFLTGAKESVEAATKAANFRFSFD